MGKPLAIALIVGDADGLELYTKRLVATDVTFFTFKNIQEFIEAPKKENSFSGVVLDMKTALRATASEKEFLTDVIETQRRLGKVTRPSSSDAVAEKIFRGQWDTFLKECENFSPRGMRTYPRRTCVLKVTLCAQEIWEPEKTVRTVTWDLSVGGCFIVSGEVWQMGGKVSFLFGDFPDPLVGRICWLRPWGASIWQMPGLGVEFLNMTASQKTSILKLHEIVARGGGT